MGMYDIVEEKGFFCYSGADGDLYRKNGLAGWRISLSWRSARIQRKSEYWSDVWVTVRDYDRGDGEKEKTVKQFEKDLEELMENGELEES